MKTNLQRSNWVLDTLLFIGFLVSFILDLTGLSIHQWIGVFGGLLIIYHLVRHWDWVIAVANRFFNRTSTQARIYYLVDILILIGFYLIIVTGLLISTWLNLPLNNYVDVMHFHITISITTLGLIVLKIGLHHRWIMRVARQTFSYWAPKSAPTISLRPPTAAVPKPGANAMTRRDFIKLMGIVSAASLVAVTSTLNGNKDVLASSPEEVANMENPPSSIAQSNGSTASVPIVDGFVPTPSSPAVSKVTPTSVPVQATSICSVRCDQHCSYPGQCRRYQDTNNNNLCDLGECM